MGIISCPESTECDPPGQSVLQLSQGWAQELKLLWYVSWEGFVLFIQ